MLQRSCVIFWVTQDSSIAFCMLFLPLKIFLFIYVCIQWFQTKTKWFSIPPVLLGLNWTQLPWSLVAKLKASTVHLFMYLLQWEVIMSICVCVHAFVLFWRFFVVLVWGFFATLACGIQLKAKYWIAHMRLRRQTPQLANRNATLPTLSARLRRSVRPLQKLPHSWWLCFTERTCYMGNIIFKAHKKRNIAFYFVVDLANESHSGEKKIHHVSAEISNWNYFKTYC